MREGKNKMMSTQMESYLAFLPKIGERQKSIVEVLEGKAMTAREIAYNICFTDLNAVKPRITELCRKGILRVCGTKKDKVTGRRVHIYERAIEE